jgi:hypothetical protein
MALEISFLTFLVLLAVASTRLIYHDGVSRQIKRMANHCKMLAALIVSTVIFAFSIGVQVHEEVEELKQENETMLRQIATQTQAREISKEPVVEAVTKNGHTITLRSPDELRAIFGSNGRRYDDLRRLDGRETADRLPVDGSARNYARDLLAIPFVHGKSGTRTWSAPSSWTDDGSEINEARTF